MSDNDPDIGEAVEYILIFERPLEHRASSRSQLRRLVHRTIVEQLSTLTGRSIDELMGGDWDDED